MKHKGAKIWIKARLQTTRHWLWCVLGIVTVLLLPGLKNGIAGITLYRPTWIEIGVALGIGFIAIVWDDELGGDKIDSPAVYRRKRKHAFLLGLGILGMIEKILGG